MEEYTNLILKIRNACIELAGFIELIIGLSTLLFVTLFNFFSIVEKPLEVLVFVTISAVISASIGYGILNLKNWARVLLIFFSGYVIILKGLLYLGIMEFSGEIITTPPPYIKDLISFLYHIFLVIFFTQPNVASRFKTQR
ncbi:MAG: hypothetical protein ISS34_01555 [Candidatus Omnitrophica bacterium]|nr:hypothetical protein [Candidatus Omnitrophota bacterium]